MYRVSSNAIWHSLPGVVAAYQPIAAQDPFAARQNVAHRGARFGVYTAVPGVAPAWAGAIGWTFNGSTQYLKTGILTVLGLSMIVRFRGVSGSDKFTGVYGYSGEAFYLSPRFGASLHAYGYNSANSVSGAVGSGVMAVTPKGGYLNGMQDSIFTATAITTPYEIYIGNVNTLLSSYGLNGSVQSALISSRTLSPAEVWLASRQMAYCEQNPDWNAWARQREYYYEPQVTSGVDELLADGVTTAAPSLGTPALSQIHALSGISVSTGAPALGTPVITQVHALTATEIATGAPTLGTPVAAETHALTATGIATGAPTLGTPAITQVHTLTATEIATGAPTLGTPAITQVHLLTAPALDTTAPSLALPAISQLHVLVAMIIATGAATVGTPYLVQGLMVAPSSRTVSVSAETRSNNVAASSRTRTA